MVIMENADDDAFASLPIATKKFQFKKVEKSSSLASKSNTTSPFFKKIQQKSSERDKVYTLPRNVIPNNFEADPLKEKLENLFKDEEAPESHKKPKARISNSQKISIGHNTFKKSSTPNSYTNSTNEKVAQLCGTSSGIETISNKLSNKMPVKRFETPLKKDSNEMKSKVAPIFNFHKAKKKDSVDDKPCFPTSISSSSHSSKSRLQDSKNTPESCTKNASKFHFKKKTVVGVPKESLVDLFCDSQSFTDSRTTNYDTGVTFSVEETNEVKLSPVVCSSTSNKFKDNDPEKVKHICDNVKIINIEDNRHVSSSSTKLKDTRQDTELFDLSEKDKQKKLVFKKGSSSSGSSTPDLSPVKSSLNKKQVSPKISKPLLHQEDGSSSADTTTIKPKKFVFKKLTSSSGCSTPSLSLSPKKSSLNKKEESPKSNKYLHKSVNFVKHDSHISISSDDFDDTPVKSTKTTNVSKKVLLDDEVQFISQSLQTTQADYMDDEEFERLFGEGSKPTEPQASNIPADDFDLSDINWSEKIDTPVKESDILADISDVNWSEDIFAQESYTPPDAFKDRVDDAAEFKGHYHFSDTMDEVLHQKFGLREFRPQQREIINACLNRHDCFVLMPTGGGKSLCYQLPAVLSEGVTIVISPLRALISDQVDKLNALDICSAHLCSDVSREDSTMVFSKLHCREPLIKLLYLTPEKINASMAVADLLKSLYQRGKLARVVIDEAHCLSQWGHDFRPDYKQLYKLREQFRDVPIMCLTATATKHVETDVINTLKLTKVKRFIMSFNRPNIKYQVIPKTGKFATAEIIKLIRSKFYKKSGIIYCLARNDCDTIAEQLNRQGIMTRPYHAGMNDKIREAIQREWMQDRFYVIVATIAFGMGIDKPDVRFVIHNSIPKSVEAFYQESGRAGRDGEISYSYLFYNYTDVLRLQKIMQMEKANRKTMDGHNNNLRQMVSFAENVVDCRRHLQLLHLGENFDRNICIRNKGTTCDNCENINRYKEVDVTKEARELGTLVKDLSVRDVTMIQIADTYKGSKAKLIVDRRYDKHKFYGAGSSMDRTDIHRILKDLMIKNIFRDHLTYTGDFPVVYIKPGSKFDALFFPNFKLTLAVSKGRDHCANYKPSPADISYSELDGIEESLPAPLSLDSPGPSRAPVANVAKKGVATKYTKQQIEKLKVQCHEELLEECRRLALERNVTLSSIMNLSAIKTMSDVLPKTQQEMLKIQHVTAANYKKFGDFFLTITKKFRDQVDKLQEKQQSENLANTSLANDDDFWCSSQSSYGGGVKRKSTGCYKRGGKKFKGGGRKKWRTPKKKASPKSGKSKSTKKYSAPKQGGGGGSGLGLMPVLHIK